MQPITGYHIFRELYADDKISVYRGKRSDSDKSVILKVLNSEYPLEEDVARLKYEYNLLKDLALPGVIHAYALEHQEHHYELILEDIPESTTLKELLDKKPLSIGVFLALSIKLADALHQLHSAHIIHKDINPHNIIISKEGDLVKLIDFSIATHLSEEITEVKIPEALEGTLAYISPEQTTRMNRGIDERTDLYSLGVTFYEMLTQQLLFNAQDPMEWVHCHIAKQPIPPNKIRSDIPEVIAAIVIKLLSKTPEDRYATAHGLKSDLEQCLTEWQKKKEIIPFTLGKNDRSSVFHIPEKLYGREREVQLLLDAYERINRGGRELLLVSGRPGIGKSSLVNEVHKPIVRQRGYFVAGKFDQLRRIPYGALIQAFRKLIQQILGENKEKLVFWRDQLNKNLSPNGQIIIDVIPEVELLIGKQPSVPVLPPSESHNRFKLVFFDFVRIFSNADHPLVIYLDDLQWADDASCHLLKELLLNSALNYLLIIGAYRDNEVAKDHPLMMIIEELNKINIPVSNVKLETLSLPSVRQLVADTLSTEIDIEFLVKLIHEKTAGNPFFVKLFFNDLYRQGYIKFDLKENEWLWDIGTLRELQVTENVVDLIISKIERFPAPLQDLLKVAACIGNQFDLEPLALIYDKPIMEIAQILWLALQENLIIPLNDNYKLAMVDKKYASQDKIMYKFSHDRIQQAAYYMLSPDQQKITNLKLGRILLEKLPIEEQEERIFDITNHFNASIDLLEDKSEKIRIAELNLKAGLKAKQSASYEAAESYFKYGIDLLGEKGWDEHYHLLFDLKFNYAECQYSLTRFEKAIQLFDQLIEIVPSPLDKAKIILSQLFSYEIQCDYDKVVEMGIKGLNTLGLKVSPKPSSFKIAIELVKTRWHLRHKKPEDFLNVPLMENPERKLMMEFVLCMGVSLFIKDPKLHAFLALTSIRQIFDYGMSPGGVTILMTYAMLQVILLKDYDLGCRYGKVSVELVDQFDNPRAITNIHYTNTNMLAAWDEPYKDCLAQLNECYHLARHAGELNWASFSAAMIPFMMFMKGDLLSDIDKQIKNTIDFVKLYKNLGAINHLVVWAQMISVLRGEQPALVLKEEIKKFLDVKVLFNDPVRIIDGSIYLINAYFLNDLQSASHLIEKLKPFVDSLFPIFSTAEYYFYKSLTLLSMYPNATFWQRIKYKREIEKSLNKFKLWSGNYAPNFQARYCLIQSGIAAYIHNDINTAYRYYEQAIEAAEQYEQIHLIAIINEFLARIFLLHNQPMTAKGYFQEAMYAYQQWGVQFKVNLLQKEFPESFLKQEPSTPNLLGRSISKSAHIKQILDLTSVMKSSQVISSQVKLDALLRTLIQIMLENAGAERGFVLLFRNEALLVEAEGNVSETESITLKHQPVEEREDISLSVIRYVQNVRETLILDNAVEQGDFTEDPYILKNKSLSILCIPIIHQANLLGILYLENNLVPGVFTPERLEVLKLLASQMAISLENALLYNAYNQFVPHEFLDLLGKRSIIDIHLGDHVQKYMTVMFSDIRNFTKLSEKMSPDEIFSFVNEFLGYIGPIIKKNNGFIDKYIGDAIMALFPGDPNDAVVTAINMQRELENYNQQRLASGQEAIRLGIGINSGSLMLGTLGSENHLETSVLSDAVNVAARLEELTKEYNSQILISEMTYQQLNGANRSESRFVGKIAIRGKEEEVALWEIFSAEPDQLRENKNAISEQYNEAITWYYEGKYKKALQKFKLCSDKCPSDKVINLYIAACNKKIK